MRFVTDDESKKQYKRFLEENERCNFQQSLEWAEVKKPNWIPEVISAEDEEKNIIGSLCVWIRKIPIFGNIMYAPRGPVCDVHDLAILKQLTDGAKELAKKYKAIVLRIEPDVESDDQVFRDIVTNLGYHIKDDAKDFMDEIQPRYVFRLDIKGKTEEEVMAGFHQKWRYNIRLAGRKGVTVKEGTREDLKDFHRIMMETGARDGFIIRPLEYFEKMYDNLAPDHMKVLMAYYEGKPISGVVDEPHPQYGLYRFKKGFGGKFTEFLGEIYIPYKPFTYKLYKISEKLFRNLRQIKMNLKNGKKTK